MKQATREIIYNIMRNRGPMKPHEVLHELMAMGIYIDSDTLKRQYRRWKEDIKKYPPHPCAKYRTHLYELRDGV